MSKTSLVSTHSIGDGGFAQDPRSGPYIEVPAHPATRGLRVRCVHD
ncbi:MAG: hypothetical protein M5U28_50860 [Sandaracinaceae bacterium]|nr:hypothetical protein [Sandaracinaceae bacterium]